VYIFYVDQTVGQFWKQLVFFIALRGHVEHCVYVSTVTTFHFNDQG